MATATNIETALIFSTQNDYLDKHRDALNRTDLKITIIGGSIIVIMGLVTTGMIFTVFGVRNVDQSNPFSLLIATGGGLVGGVVVGHKLTQEFSARDNLDAIKRTCLKIIPIIGCVLAGMIFTVLAVTSVDLSSPFGLLTAAGGGFLGGG